MVCIFSKFTIVIKLMTMLGVGFTVTEPEVMEAYCE